VDGGGRIAEGSVQIARAPDSDVGSLSSVLCPLPLERR